jgi:tetratricopeptide (TPR) repeat protein
VVAEPGGQQLPWELARDPATDGVLALRAGSFVRGYPGAAAPPREAEPAGRVRVLLVIARPGGPADVPFRSVASQLVRLDPAARAAFDLDVLRPPTFAALTAALDRAARAGRPYHVVHFDGHGAYLDPADIAALAAGTGPGTNPLVCATVSPARLGPHGYLLFEDPRQAGNRVLVDGPVLGRALADAGVRALVLNACRSAHADLATAPEQAGQGDSDPHRRVRAFGSLAEEVMDAGLGGVVAMRYNLYVVTAATFIADLYAALADGATLGEAVTAGRRMLAADPHRKVTLAAHRLDDWLVPVVYEAEPVQLLRPGAPADQPGSGPGAVADAGLPAAPDAGFYGRDETLLALDRAFDTHTVVLLHAWAGAGKTAAAAEFARWYAHTGGLGETGLVLFTEFTRHQTLAQVLDRLGEAAGVSSWQALDDHQRRAEALRILARAPVLWVWDNVEPIAGFPAGIPSAWTTEQQTELAGFLRAARGTKARFLLTSRREETGWLGELPARVALPPMPMAERAQLADALAAKRGRRLGGDGADWRALLEFTQGNPLTLTVLVSQALRDRLTSAGQVEEFVGELRAGAARVRDDAAQGRARSLAASLDYGLRAAFDPAERACLAPLALFQGFVDAKAHARVAGLDREAAGRLLDRAAEIGLLTALGDGYYTIHPALPWHLRHTGTASLGPEAEAAYTAAIASLGRYWLDRFNQGHAQVISVLAAEEANLLHARQLARAAGRWNDVTGAMQGLHVLYEHAGRTVEWARLVDELVPDLTDPAAGGPRPGTEEPWRLLVDYRTRLARQARDWPTAERLARLAIDHDRRQAAHALAQPPETLDDGQRNRIDTLGVSLTMLAAILSDQHNPDCAGLYQEAIGLAQRVGDRRHEAAMAGEVGTAYLQVPALGDLDQAEHWYRHSLSLTEKHDTVVRSQGIGQLGRIAYQRLLAARQAGASDEVLRTHRAEANDRCEEALGLLPANAIADRAVLHHQLGALHIQLADGTGTALAHYQQALRLFEQAGDRYRAGGTRFNFALILDGTGRVRDARWPTPGPRCATSPRSAPARPPKRTRPGG